MILSVGTKYIGAASYHNWKNLKWNPNQEADLIEKWRRLSSDDVCLLFHFLLFVRAVRLIQDTLQASSPRHALNIPISRWIIHCPFQWDIVFDLYLLGFSHTVTALQSHYYCVWQVDLVCLESVKSSQLQFRTSSHPLGLQCHILWA